MIIELPLNGQFQDAVANILTSQTAVSGVVENVGNIVNVIHGKKMEKNCHFLETFLVIKPLEVMIFPKNYGYFFSIYT